MNVNHKERRLESLECWKEARKLVVIIYKETNNQSFSKDFGLKDQTQRAAISIMGNIAEGFEAYSDKEFIRYLNIANKSCSELKSHIYAAFDLEYITTNSSDIIIQQINKCSNFSKALIKYLKYSKLTKDT